MCVLVHVFTDFPYNIILPCYGYQFHSCIFYVGLTFLRQGWNPLFILEPLFVVTFFLFDRWMLFFFLMQWCPLLLSKVCPSSRGLVKDWQKLSCIQVGNSCWNTRFPSSSIWAFLHYYLVMYVVRRCPSNSTFVDAQNSHRSIVFVWGCERCTTTTCQLIRSIYYYLKDMDWVHLACRCLPYGDKHQTLLIDDEPNKVL